MRNAALVKHGYDRCHHPQRDPSHDDKIACAVAVIGVEPHRCVRREDEDQLVQVVRQNQNQKQRSGDIKKTCPFWQPVVFGSSERERDQHAQRRDEQHREIIAVPEIADGGGCGGKEEFDGSDRQPEHAQRRRHRQIPAHLRLHNALPKRNAPPRHKPDINEAPQQRYRQKIRRVPMPARDDACQNGADDQKRHNAASENIPFFLRRHKITCLSGFLYAKHIIRGEQL